MKLRGIVVAVALALTAAACGGNEGTTNPPPGGAGANPSAAAYPISVKAANGRVTIEARPTHIVSLSPTATEMLFAIGAGDQVVAVDDNSNYPPEAPMTKLSGYEPNVEAIAGYDPDLVVYANDPGDLEKSLDALKIPALSEPAATDFDDVYAQIEQLGEVTGHATEAEDVTTAMKSRIKTILNGVTKPAAPLTYYHELDDTYFSVTSKTFIGKVYSLLGLKNIADAADKKGSGYPQLSAEYIVESDPDLIFLADTKCCHQSAASVAKRPGWGSIAAVQNDSVIALDDDVASRWGPRIVDLLQKVADAVDDAVAR